MASRRKKRARVEKIQIYLSESVDADRVLLGIWKICRDHGRPQDTFRNMLIYGAREMIDAGLMPEAAMKKVLGIRTLARPPLQGAPASMPTRPAPMSNVQEFLGDDKTMPTPQQPTARMNGAERTDELKQLEEISPPERPSTASILRLMG